MTTMLTETFINLCEVELSNLSDIEDINDLCLNILYEQAKQKVKAIFEDTDELGNDKNEIDITLIDKDPYSTIYDLSGTSEFSQQEKEEKIKKCRKLLDINMVINNVINDSVSYDSSGNDNYNVIKDKKYRKEFSKRLMQKIAKDHMTYNGRKFNESIDQDGTNDSNVPILIEIQKESAEIVGIDYETDISGRRKFGKEYYKNLGKMHHKFVESLSNENLDDYIEKQNNLEEIKNKMKDISGIKHMSKTDLNNKFEIEKNNHFNNNRRIYNEPQIRETLPQEFRGQERQKQGKFDIWSGKNTFYMKNKKYRK